jgi:Ca-activated chloride channel family protein
MFHDPWFLLLLPLVPVIGWRIWRSQQHSGVTYSSAASDWDVRPSWRQRILWLPAAMLLVAATLMIVALARPRVGRDQTIIHSEGIAIELVVDRSGSMRARDFQIDGAHVDRLTAIKNVASKFVLGDEEATSGNLSGRISDLVGLVTFAGYADAITPLTLDHRFLVDQLQRTQIVNRRDEDGTAIGDAISLAVDKLSTLAKRQSADVKSKIVILLTDGENTAGEIDPTQAAELAATLGIKIYTIGVGTKGRAPIPVGRSASGQMLVQYEFVNIDEKTLREIAEATGGQYFRATDTTSLESIYEEIDQLEKTKMETQQFVDFRELAIQSSRLGGTWLPPLLLVALGLLAGRVILNRTLLRQFG